MNPDEKKLLEETATLARETSVLVKKIHRHVMVNSVMRVVYWVIIIGASLGAFWLIQPYIDSVRSLTSGGESQESLMDLFF